uniref:Uncharacterized protein n=1 Tax=Pavo cristatus TaxID=9049 RepID=A0A8C9FCB2_PAVCR
MLSRLLREHQARQSERRELQGEPAPPRPSRGLIGWGGAAPCCLIGPRSRQSGRRGEGEGGGQRWLRALCVTSRGGATTRC